MQEDSLNRIQENLNGLVQSQVKFAALFGYAYSIAHLGEDRYRANWQRDLDAVAGFYSADWSEIINSRVYEDSFRERLFQVNSVQLCENILPQFREFCATVLEPQNDHGFALLVRDLINQQIQLSLSSSGSDPGRVKEALFQDFHQHLLLSLALKTVKDLFHEETVQQITLSRRWQDFIDLYGNVLYLALYLSTCLSYVWSYVLNYTHIKQKILFTEINKLISDNNILTIINSFLNPNG